MALAKRIRIEAAEVRRELVGVEDTYRQRSKTLRALLRALEAEEPEDTADAPETN